MHVQHVQPGVEVILLRPEVSPSGHTVTADQLVSIERVEDGVAYFLAATSCRWQPIQEMAAEAEALLDRDRYLVLVDQEIDGHTFTAEVPSLPGFYWFYGSRDRRKGSTELLLVEHRAARANRTFWFGGGCMLLQG
jgi:hypothetical protein